MRALRKQARLMRIFSVLLRRLAGVTKGSVANTFFMVGMIHCCFLGVWRLISRVKFGRSDLEMRGKRQRLD